MYLSFVYITEPRFLIFIFLLCSDRGSFICRKFVLQECLVVQISVELCEAINNYIPVWLDAAFIFHLGGLTSLQVP